MTMKQTKEQFIGISYDELLTDNAKLRELACTLVYCMQVHNDCDGCRLNGSKGELSYDPLLACDGLHERMRELGIEVDGGAST